MESNLVLVVRTILCPAGAAMVLFLAEVATVSIPAEVERVSIQEVVMVLNFVLF